ncbi:MAG: peptidoglycan DD-metalloendopeptidase family protein [Pseudomonadales bacterium]|nr:peptidoglycan DD-metalloendopeptidase family protein [Pseudomonadales bacterium]
MQENRIPEKQQVNAHWIHFPKSHFVLLGTTAIALGIILSIMPSQEAVAIRHRIDLQVPLTIAAEADLDILQQANSANAKPPSSVKSTKTNSSYRPELNWHYEEIRSGDNLARIFSRVGLSAEVLHALMHSHKKSKVLKSIHPGQTLEFGLDNKGALVEFIYNPSRTQVFKAIADSQSATQFSVEISEKVIEKHLAFAEASIDQSLFLSAQAAGLSDNTTMELANIFGWDVDFALDIRTGDSFSVLYEENYLEGEKVGYGKILVAKFSNNGKNLTAIRYEDEHGNADYYTPEGLSMRKAFLRSPIHFARISSRFNLRRMHPVLHKIRAHKGVDYAASRGTPIKATGDGKIIHAGRKGGYGKAVVIQHGQRYNTLYAHMSKFGRGIRKGKRVKQGQTIGYVGSSGLATGPHLHYEFRVNGVHKNPVTVKLPHAQPLAKKYRSDFQRSTRDLLSQLALRAQASKFAQLDR